jgi:hypothetical protein
MNTSKWDYMVYAIDVLPAGVFGESYVVCAAYALPNDVFRGEWYILTQRPREELHHGTIDAPGKGLPPELGVVDVEFARAEALSQARIGLLELLESESRSARVPSLRVEQHSKPAPRVLDERQVHGAAHTNERHRGRA